MSDQRQFIKAVQRKVQVDFLNDTQIPERNFDEQLEQACKKEKNQRIQQDDDAFINLFKKLKVSEVEDHYLPQYEDEDDEDDIFLNFGDFEQESSDGRFERDTSANSDYDEFSEVGELVVEAMDQSKLDQKLASQIFKKHINKLFTKKNKKQLRHSLKHSKK